MQSGKKPKTEERKKKSTSEIVATTYIPHISNDRATLQASVKETATRWVAEGRSITVSALAKATNTTDMNSISGILIVDGYKCTNESDEDGFKIWKPGEGT